MLQFDWDNEGKITGQWIVNQNIHKVSGELNNSWFVIELLPYGVDCGESIRGTISSDKKTIQGDWDQMTIIGPLSGSFNGFSTNTQY